MGDGGLHKGRVLVVVGVLDEVLDQAIDVVRWWWALRLGAGGKVDCYLWTTSPSSEAA